MRLFLAIQLEEEIKRPLSYAVDVLRTFARKGSFTRKENLHLTLVFLGETWQVEQAKQAMDQVAAQPFVLYFGGVGTFRRDGGDIYWVGVDKNPLLTDLYQQLVLALTKQGFSLENREYRPHLTLGRQIRMEPEFDQEKFARSIPRMSCTVSSISLMNSERVNGKLTYTEIYRRVLE